MTRQHPPRNRRHLHDPARPRQVRRDPMDLERVQRWVLSSLAVATGVHLSLGLVLAAAYVEASRTDARVGLLVIAGVFGVLSVAGGLAIHRRRLPSWWLLLGVVPAVVGGSLIG